MSALYPRIHLASLPKLGRSLTAGPGSLMAGLERRLNRFVIFTTVGALIAKPSAHAPAMGVLAMHNYTALAELECRW